MLKLRLGVYKGMKWNGIEWNNHKGREGIEWNRMCWGTNFRALISLAHSLKKHIQAHNYF